jgi:hypothetical protein
VVKLMVAACDIGEVWLGELGNDGVLGSDHAGGALLGGLLPFYVTNLVTDDFYTEYVN